MSMFSGAPELVNKGQTPPAGCALRSATVTSPTGVGPEGLRVKVDGDDDPIAVVSLTGALTNGTRVMVLFWPPHGAYILGPLWLP